MLEVSDEFVVDCEDINTVLLTDLADLVTDFSGDNSDAELAAAGVPVASRLPVVRPAGVS